MLYCFADHVALPSSFSDTSKTNLGCCHARTQKRYAQQQQQLKHDEWHGRPDESLSMHVQVDGIEFNHRNDRPFFFLVGAGRATGQATWMVCGDEGLDDWCPGRKSQWICGSRWKKSCLVINWSVWRIQEAPHFPSNLASPYPLYHLTPVWGSTYGASHSAKMVLFITRPCHRWSTVLLDQTLEESPGGAPVDAAPPASEVKSNTHFKIVLPSICSEPLDQAKRIFPVCADSFHELTLFQSNYLSCL